MTNTVTVLARKDIYWQLHNSVPVKITISTPHNVRPCAVSCLCTDLEIGSGVKTYTVMFEAVCGILCISMWCNILQCTSYGKLKVMRGTCVDWSLMSVKTRRGGTLLHVKTWRKFSVLIDIIIEWKPTLVKGSKMQANKSIYFLFWLHVFLPHTTVKQGKKRKKKQGQDPPYFCYTALSTGHDRKHDRKVIKFENVLLCDTIVC